MFTILNVLFIGFAGANLYAVLAKAAPSIREVSVQLIGTDGGLERLRTALILAAMAQVYLTFLVFPLKELKLEAGLAWAVLMTLAACESIYTGQKMWEAVAAGDGQAAFPIHDSVAYKVWQVGYNLATIAACVYLVLPQG